MRVAYVAWSINLLANENNKIQNTQKQRLIDAEMKEGLGEGG